MKRFIVTLVITCSAYLSISQNIIKNGDFEQGTIPQPRPNSTNWLNLATDWETASPNCTNLVYGPGYAGIFDSRSFNGNISNRISSTFRYAAITFPGVKSNFGKFTTGTIGEGCYEISFWSANTTGGNNSYQLKVYLTNRTTCKEKLIYTSPLKNNPYWEQVIGEVYISNTDAADGYDRISFVNTSSNHFYIDEIKMEPSTFDPTITNGPNTVLIENRTYTNNKTVTACDKIVSGNDVNHPGANGNVVVSTGSVIYKANNSISLKPGFKVLNGNNKNFSAEIHPTCYCHDPAIANAGSNVIFCKENGILSLYTSTNNIGQFCSGTSAKWTTTHPTALGWLSNPNSCVTAVNPPFSANPTSIIYTLEVDNGYGDITYDQVLVQIVQCINGRLTRIKNPNSTITEEENADLSIYPNPTNHSITIESQHLVTRVEVVSIEGKVVIDQSPNELQPSIDLSSLGTSFYFVRVHTESGIEVRKVIKR